MTFGPLGTSPLGSYAGEGLSLTFNGSGDLLSYAAVLRAATAELAGGGSLTVGTPILVKFIGQNFAGLSSLAAYTIQLAASEALLSGAGSLATSASQIQFGTALLEGAGTCFNAVSLRALSGASFTGLSTFNGEAVRVPFASASLFGTCSFVAASNLVQVLRPAVPAVMNGTGGWIHAFNRPKLFFTYYEQEPNVYETILTNYPNSETKLRMEGLSLAGRGSHNYGEVEYVALEPPLVFKDSNLVGLDTGQDFPGTADSVSTLIARIESLENALVAANTLIDSLQSQIDSMQEQSDASVSDLQSQIDGVVDDLAAEAATRASDDTILQGNITSEASTRASADSSINATLSSHTSSISTISSRLDNHKSILDRYTYWFTTWWGVTGSVDTGLNLVKLPQSPYAPPPSLTYYWPPPTAT